MVNVICYICLYSCYTFILYILMGCDSRKLDLINSCCSPTTTASAEKIYTGSTLYNMRIHSQS